ncbi:MAG TPA: hypothetical protein VFI87_17875 [Hyphomicrobiaceae bacterium]|nr:hypothetical protein [Hyphomicrobiaceae bacterium]
MFNDDGTKRPATSPNGLRTACPVLDDPLRFYLGLLDWHLHEISGNTDLLACVRRQTLSREESILKRRQIDPDATRPVFCHPCNAHFDHLLSCVLLLQRTSINCATQQY